MMRLAFVLTILFLVGFATSSQAADLQGLDLGPMAQSCLTDPPAATETFMISLCEGFADIAREREARVHRQAQGKIEATTCDAVCRYPIDKAHEDREAIEAGRARAAQLAKSARLARRMPSLAELDRDLAILESWRPQMPLMPMIREPIHCTSYSLGLSVNTDCY